VLTNAGHLAPGSSPGTLTLNGNYVQTAAGVFDIEVASTTLFDAFLINGTATLDGTLALSCVLTCDLHDGDEFVILDSTGDLMGTFADVTALGFGSGFAFNVLYDYNADLVRLQVLEAVAPGTVLEPESLTLVFTALGVMCALTRWARPSRRSRSAHR
jgi:subtilase-type serine protease